MFKSLSGRFLILTIVFVMLAEVLIFVPSVARFREDYLLLRLERAQIASLAVLADDMLEPSLEQELLENAGVFNVVLRRDEMRELALSSPLPGPVLQSFDLRNAGAITLMRDAIARLLTRQDQVIRVIGTPVREGGEQIEVTMQSMPLRDAMLEYGRRILVLSAVISAITAVLLFLAVQVLMVRPIKSVVRATQLYAAAPHDTRRIIAPTSNVRELREAETALSQMQTDLTGALRQKDRLAQLGEAVAKISHDLRNILTSAQLFTDRIELSQDPTVQRMVPKLVNSITRAVNLCESTLAFGRAEEAPPTLTRFALAPVVNEVIDAERLATGDYDLSFAEDVPGTMMLRADPEQIYRVLTNLVRNARQAIMATGNPGEIAVKAIEDEEAWWIYLRDTGPGLPAKARDHLFQPFQGRVSKGGSGLGLAIAAELLRGHGGRLDLHHSDETGTTFAICLPKKEFSETDIKM